jgi:hypothetical protein
MPPGQAGGDPAPLTRNVSATPVGGTLLACTTSGSAAGTILLRTGTQGGAAD